MSKQNLFKSSLVSGTIILTFTGILSRIIGFFYRIFLSRTIGAEGLGIYQLIFPVFALLLSVSAAGIQTAVSRCCAQCETDRQARRYLTTGLLMSLSLSLLCVLFVCRQAEWIADRILGEARCVSLLRIMSLSLPFACAHSCINGYYYGKKKTAVPAVSQILEQAVRVGGVWLIARIVLDQNGVLTAKTAVWGLFIGEFASSLFAVTMVRIHKILQRESAVTPHAAVGRLQIFRSLAALAVPLTLNRILVSIVQSAESLMIPNRLRAFGYSGSDALAVYGILTGMVFSTIMFPAVISNSLSVMLLPAVSGACAARRTDLVRKAVRQTVEICTLFGLTCTLGFLLAGTGIGTHLFHNALAGIYIRTLSWICPFLFLGSTLCSILHGLGKATATLLINLSGSLIRIGCVFFGIPVFGMKAYLWGMLGSQIYLSVCAWLCIRRCAAKASAG